MKIVKFAAISALALGIAVFGAPTEASAVTICNNGEACAWPTGSAYGGKFRVADKTTFCWAYPMAGANYPQFANNSDYSIDVWDGNNCNGRHGLIYPRSRSSNMGYWSNHIKTITAR